MDILKNTTESNFRYVMAIFYEVFHHQKIAIFIYFPLFSITMMSYPSVGPNMTNILVENGILRSWIVITPKSEMPKPTYPVINCGWDIPFFVVKTIINHPMFDG